MYRPPSSNMDFFDECKEMLHQCDFKKVIIMGNLNLNWEDNVREKTEADNWWF